MTTGLAGEPGNAGEALNRGLPGGIAVSRLRVYDWPTTDGRMGGSPHLHTASTEGYVVLVGTGELESLSSRGLETTPLHPGAVVWFTPGTVHRLINGSGDLDILTLMSNGGLPEAGDAVLTFPAEVLADRDRYAAAAALPQTDDQAELERAARARRDLALEGWAELRAHAEADLVDALDGLYSAAAALVAPRIDTWREIWQAGPAAQSAATGQTLELLAAAQTASLYGSGVAQLDPLPGLERWGMCGRLTVWPKV
ncbi:cupin domain-containing protein [Gryllotalpicola protaetiae]|uniref:Cupin domain-containing protein n=1 Tax=Gryllotalpicola protaetiae TaxID=2419771 RepID=A0A387BMZ0_9MICO|nr:cupin domain-containing protein [Gryllotalpicola protaetiae]